MHCIHVTDPATEDRADKLGKVRPFLSTLQQNFPCLFAPGVALSIDEAMIKDQISDTALQRGQSEKLSADRDIVFCRWYDRRDVFVVAKNTTGRDTVKPRTRFTPNDMITVPEMIVDYNRNMGGVDHLDQFRGYYNVGRVGRKWWKYVLFGLFNFATVHPEVSGKQATAKQPMTVVTVDLQDGSDAPDVRQFIVAQASGHRIDP